MLYKRCESLKQNDIIFQLKILPNINTELAKFAKLFCGGMPPDPLVAFLSQPTIMLAPLLLKF